MYNSAKASPNSFPQNQGSSGHKENNEEHHVGSGTASANHSSFAGSRNSFNSFESDRWSQRGISSRVSINLGDIGHSEDDDDSSRLKKCLWIHKLWRNFILPGFFGIDNRRIIEKLDHKHPISSQLLTNVFFYNNMIRGFIRDELLCDIKALATQLYFPTGQIEADGLSVISGEIWAATYLLLCIHNKLREADFQLIRSAYSSLAWDSGHAYRATLKFHQIHHEFREHILPLWQKIEHHVGIPENNDFAQTDNPKPALGNLSLSLKASSNSDKSKRKSRMQVPPPPPPLPSIRICDDVVLLSTLKLRIVPEMKSAMIPSDTTEKDFTELEYGKQMEIIKGLLGKPAATLQNVVTVLRQLQLSLLNDGAALPRSDDISCARAMHILTATLKLLKREVKLPPSLRFEIKQSLSATSEEIHSVLAYTDWVISKISEFHSMLRICYNFALMCFDLDLPGFETVLNEQRVSEQVFKPTAKSFGRSQECLKDKLFEYKVMSLTKLMMEASTAFPSMQKQGGIDENFQWEHFYKTDYHTVLQRLPLRLGFNLLQFSIANEDKMLIRRRIGSTNSNSPIDEDSDQNIAARQLWSIYRKTQSLETSECGSLFNNSQFVAVCETTM